MSDRYVEAGYVEAGYVVGDSVDLSTAVIKKVNFVVDNKGLSDTDLDSLLIANVGETYKDDVNVILGNSLRVGEKIADVFTIKEVAGQLKQSDLDAINNSIANVQSQIPTSSEVANALLTDTNFTNTISTNVLNSISVNLVAANGDIITTGLTYDAVKDAYVLDYDTSLLDGTDYTIEIKLS